MEKKKKRIIRGSADKAKAIELTKFVIMNKPKGQTTEDAIAPIAEKFGYANWRTPYQYVIQEMHLDPDFNSWWQKNKQKQPKNK